MSTNRVLVCPKCGHKKTVYAQSATGSCSNPKTLCKNVKMVDKKSG